jgi:hypothetical protein
MATGFISFWFPISNVALISIFAKLPHKNLELAMGVLMGGASAARLVGPLWGTALLASSGDGVVFLLLLGIVVLGTGAAVIVVMRSPGSLK